MTSASSTGPGVAGLHGDPQGDTAAGDASLAAFYRDMNPRERRTFWACFWGYALDALDYMVYPLVVGTLIALWHVDRSMAGLAVTGTLLASACGGWLAGYLADRIGRVKTLQITVLWFSALSLACAFAQDFTQLSIARALLGFGFGGEWAAGAVLIGEAIRPQYRGRAVGTVQSAWAVGWGGAVLLQALMFTLLPPEQAWRAMFAFGALPAVLLIYIRRHVEEPAVSQRQREAAGAQRPSILEIFRPPMLRTTVLASLFATGCQGGYYAITTWVPSFLTTERHLSVVGSAGYLAFVIGGSFTGYLVGAWMADRFGRKPLFISFAVGAIALVLAYTQLPISDRAMMFLGFPLGFFASGYFAGVGAFLTELFPTALRGSGQGFCYSFGRGLGALFPTLVGFFSTQYGLAAAIAMFAVLAYGLLLASICLLPETRGRAL
jgi:MFS family permease